MEKKFKNRVAFTGPTSLRKAMVEELLKIGYKWVATSKDDYEEYKYTKNFYDVDFGKVGLGNNIKPRISCLTFTLPEQWDECLKACSEVAEEEKPELDSLPEEYIVACNNGQECTEVLDKFYSTNRGKSYNWKYIICSPKISSIYRVSYAVENYIRPEFSSLPVLTFEKWKNLKEKEYVLKENNMKMEKFSIGGSLPLKKAFVEEGGFKVYDDYTLTEEWPLLTMLENGTIAGIAGVVYPKHFELPKDWDAALEYAKLYFNQKGVKVFDLGNGYKAEVDLQGNTIRVEGKGIIKAIDFVTWFDNNFSLAPLTTLSGYICKLSLSVGCLKKVDFDIVESIYKYIRGNA